jgi:hypothetical protein
MALNSWCKSVLSKIANEEYIPKGDVEGLTLERLASCIFQELERTWNLGGYKLRLSNVEGKIMKCFRSFCVIKVVLGCIVLTFYVVETERYYKIEIRSIKPASLGM